VREQKVRVMGERRIMSFDTGGDSEATDVLGNIKY
jgi:hypothetical protein